MADKQLGLAYLLSKLSHHTTWQPLIHRLWRWVVSCPASSASLIPASAPAQLLAPEESHRSTSVLSSQYLTKEREGTQAKWLIRKVNIGSYWSMGQGVRDRHSNWEIGWSLGKSQLPKERWKLQEVRDGWVPNWNSFVPLRGWKRKCQSGRATSRRGTRNGSPPKASGGICCGM